MKPIPVLAADLISELDASYPPRHPRLTDGERQIWWDAAKRDLIDNLKLRLEKSIDSTKLLNKER